MQSTSTTAICLFFAAARLASHSTPAEDVCVRLPSRPLHTSVRVSGGFGLPQTPCIMLLGWGNGWSVCTCRWCSGIGWPAGFVIPCVFNLTTHSRIEPYRNRDCGPNKIESKSIENQNLYIVTSLSEMSLTLRTWLWNVIGPKCPIVP